MRVSSEETSLTGEVRDRLPFHHFNVVDMSTSQEAIASQLLQHVMHMEKPEFEGHLRSLKNDLASTKQNMAKEQVRGSRTRWPSVSGV